MASRKQTTKKTKKSSSTNIVSKKTESNEQLDFLNSEILMIVLFVASLVLFLSHFGLIGALGKYLKIVQLGLFGILGYALPMLIFIGGAFLTSNPDQVWQKLNLQVFFWLYYPLMHFYH